MRKLLIYIMILSLIDAAATCAGIKLGYLQEANPVLAAAAMKAPVAVCSASFLASCLFLYIIYSFRKSIKWLKKALALIFAVKLSVVYLHLSILLTIL